MSELIWCKSSYSDSSGGECVEIAHTATYVHVRDSKRTDGPVLNVPFTSWQRFLGSMPCGE
ncbi:protein of unknown function [Streptomyces sp. WMMB 714]|uniref:DUF397 domain-containing protein n=1 Tax=Streptomyces sp. WMMB 714 TaxID=1286822 RepID=UPI0005F85D81|nr:DUF397 domain-containing protein [Streptomyces sp. WMMB 714]SCK36157.1 protein of unknown function [Streptomyces sp. WMMB 714]